ncbi:MAG: mannose-6-phosphate isomerase, class I, partial [Flavisolibacter sp.]
MELKNGIFKLNGIVQHYSWGGFEFIPKFLGLTNEHQKPYAEYWLGAHPNFPSEIVNGSTVNLNHLIASEPLATLGEQAANKFHSLPYLFKILDVRQMLSIQVHPDKRSAIIEYEEENKKGIPLNASNRNYNDRNHKPELMVALSDFWLLHGFKKRQN